MADVFISYSRFDRAVAAALAEDLAARGFDVWWDRELVAGDVFEQTIRSQIDLAKAVVVIWSQTSVESSWVRGEAIQAEKGRKVVSTHVAGFSPEDVPINFLPLHCEPVGNRDRIATAIASKGARPRQASSVAAAATAPTSSIDDLRKRATAGEPGAQFELAVRYGKGDGVARDLDEAARWFHHAAARGDPNAQYNLGVSYAQGYGVPQDQSKAIDWYAMAAAQDYPLAQIELGGRYMNGLGVPENRAEAERYFRQAAVQGSAKGQFWLAYLLYKTQAVEPDRTALDEEAARFFRLAAEQDHAEAQRNLGILHLQGRGVAKDMAEAVVWLRKAADNGDREALSRLAHMYAGGIGVAKDAAEAARLFRLCADQGGAA